MTPKEAANKVCDIWVAVNEQINEGVSKATPMEARIILFERATAFIISDSIQAERRASGAASEAKPKSDVKCKDCGNLLTVGEKEYCDANDKQYRCYKCSHK